MMLSSQKDDLIEKLQGILAILDSEILNTASGATRNKLCDASILAMASSEIVASKYSKKYTASTKANGTIFSTTVRINGLAFTTHWALNWGFLNIVARDSELKTLCVTKVDYALTKDVAFNRVITDVEEKVAEIAIELITNGAV